MANIDALKQEFWGDLQVDLAVKNTAVYLANERLKNLISTNGKKAHRSLLSHPDRGTYTPHEDINFQQKKGSKQSLEVDTFEYAAETIDIVEQMQTEEDLVSHSSKSIREGLLNGVEQHYISEIDNAHHEIAGGAAQSISHDGILQYFEEAEGTLGAYDAPYETKMRAAVFGPRTVAKLRRSKSERDTGLGDSTLQNGVVGPWHGWTVVQNNNLPWSADLDLDTNPTDGDTITIAGVTFTFKDSTSDEGDVEIETDVDDTRDNLVDAINGDDGDYEDLDERDAYMIRRKRSIKAENDSGSDKVTLEGYGDIATSEDLTDGDDGFDNEEQESVFMIRGAIDLVVQFMRLEIPRKEAGFADMPKGVVGLGTKTFKDGEIMMVKLTVDASDF